MGEDVYELEAVETQDEADRKAFLEALKRKYDFEPEEGQEEESLLLQLVAR